MTSTAFGCPASSRTSVQRLFTMSWRPSLPRCVNWPLHSPRSRTPRSVSASAAVSGISSSIISAPIASSAVQP